LRGVEGAEGVGSITVFKQRVFNCAMNRTQQGTTHTRNPIIWKGLSVQLWKPWKNSRNRKIAATPNEGKKPGRLPQRYIKNTETNTATRKMPGVVRMPPAARFQIAAA